MTSDDLEMALEDSVMGKADCAGETKCGAWRAASCERIVGGLGAL